MILREFRHLLRIHKGQIISDSEYIDCVRDILEHDTFLEMQKYIHHGRTNCLRHCVHVSYCSYLLARRWGLDYRSAARAGLIHDLFLYDWHTHAKETNEHFHGFRHPRKALINANRAFDLNPCEQDAILCHMWPLTIKPPRYKVGFIICLMDKYCGSMETFRSTRNMIPWLKKVIQTV